MSSEFSLGVIVALVGATGTLLALVIIAIFSAALARAFPSKK